MRKKGNSNLLNKNRTFGAKKRVVVLTLFDHGISYSKVWCQSIKGKSNVQSMQLLVFRKCA